jgi:hypothetical protein
VIQSGWGYPFALDVSFHRRRHHPAGPVSGERQRSESHRWPPVRVRGYGPRWDGHIEGSLQPRKRIVLHFEPIRLRLQHQQQHTGEQRLVPGHLGRDCALGLSACEGAERIPALSRRSSGTPGP